VSRPLPRSCLLGLSLLVILAGRLSARDIGQLDILQERYPRAFFFRAAEGAWDPHRYPTYESWEEQFNRLQGIMGKCLDEECVGREPRNIDFFSRFKQEHPRQAVLVHFNGNARDPRYHTEYYFPGHWVYRRATNVVEDVPAEAGESVIRVEDVGDFRVGGGRYRTSNDDIALLRAAPDGKHDWHYCEQVQLISVDKKASTIRVRRGCYGTEPLRFEAGRSRAAAHAVEGPWGRTNHILWFYNFATHCPRDREGKSCADRLVDDLARWFGPGGKLAAFDGVEFDVMQNQTRGDTDGDGIEDDGVVDGVNRYGIGMVQFARQLRERMADDFILQGDGAIGPGGSRSQRAWGLLNGIESEGWPNLRDWEIEDWSGGLNRHFFWREGARRPAFNYVNHKWVENVPGEPGVVRHPQVAFARHRLVFAACQFFDAASCYSLAPPRDPDGKFGVWDELRCGVENRLGWLGRPEGPARRLAAQSPDLLAGRGAGEQLAALVSGEVRAEATRDGVRISARDPAAPDLRFGIRGIPARGSELCVFVSMQGQSMTGYPHEIARLAEVGVLGGMVDLLADGPLTTGMKVRGSADESPIDAATGALVQTGPRAIAGKRLATRFVHPPYRAGTGYVFWTQEARVPSGGVLRFSIGMGPVSPARSDGVRFEVQAAEVSGRQAGEYRKIFERTTNLHQWLPQSVALSRYAGNRVRLKFIADCGPNDDATADHAHWGDVKIVRSGTADDEITEAERHMTWVNDRSFQSSFYFRRIRSKEVDLSFAIEGSEPVTVHAVTAYAHPDTICRVFEGGIVLANPSYQPWTFDLAKLTPGKSYRRIQAVATQDVQTNNGLPVGEQVTLGKQDALFLKRR
jgi:hypothetical protein